MGWLNRIARSITLLFMVAVAVGVAYVLSSKLDLKAQGWLMGAFTVVFLVSEAFFWKAIDGVGSLPESDVLDAAASASLSSRVQSLKRRLIHRWFILLGLKTVAGGCSALLLTSNNSIEYQRVLWLVGIVALVVSIPIALSFFHNWRQADTIKAKQFIESKRQKERNEALRQLDKAPANSLNADKILEEYTKLVASRKRASSE